MTSVRWNLAVSPEIDRLVRVHIASQGGGRKGDLSKFVEEAVRERILDEAIAEARTAMRDVPAAETDALIGDAVAWARTR